MALASYSDLLASVASWMNRTDLSAVIPDFVTISESKIAKELRLRQQITTTSITASVSTRSAPLPTDWLELENISVHGTPDTPLQYVTIEHLDAQYPEGGWSARPYVYTIEGDNVILGPTPDSAYTIDIIYYARFPTLATASTNWLMTNHPNVYLYACLREGAFFTKDAAGAVQWDGLFKQEIKALQVEDDRATHSGSALRVKKV